MTSNDIKKIGLGYICIDEEEFEKTENTLPEILETYKMAYDKNQKFVNETLINCNIEPSYILILKDEKEISKEILDEAERLSKLNNLPIVIYDSFQIKHDKENAVSLSEVKSTIAPTTEDVIEYTSVIDFLKSRVEILKGILKDILKDILDKSGMEGKKK